LRFRVGAVTHTGHVRDHNEDAFLVLPDVAPWLLVVADGMGGHQSGEVASRLTVEEMAAAFAGKPPERTLLRRRANARERLITAVEQANRRVLTESRRDAGKQGMGTTVVALLLDGANVHVAHVGDSRAYRVRGGVLEALTRDHSLVNDYLDLGLLTPEQAAAFPYKNVIVRAVGLSPYVEVEADTRQVAPGDRFLLCSDGLTDLVSETTIRDRLARGDDPIETAETLVSLALQAGGIDNVTAVVAHTHAEEP
jgi:protein phosphatase